MRHSQYSHDVGKGDSPARMEQKGEAYMRISRSWLTAPVLLSAGVLPWDLLLLRAQHAPAMHERESPRAPGASTDDSVPSGLVVVRHVNNSPQQDRQLEDQALKNPFIRGVAFQIHWSEIEPVDGKFDWSKLDQLFAAAESSKKWIQLCVYAGFFSPAWALEGAKTEQFPVQYGPDRDKILSLPMPWDTVCTTVYGWWRAYFGAAASDLM